MRQLAAALLFSTTAFAASTATVFEHVRLFDGSNVTEDQQVVIEDGKIKFVGPAAVPSDAIHIDGRGKTLLPGFIDAHSHTHSATDLHNAILFGVTTELDMMDPPNLERRLIAGQTSDQASLFYAGYAATATHGHGTEYGGNPPTIDRPEDAQRFVDDRIAEGSQYIKIVYGDTSRIPSRDRLNVISKKTLAAVITAAHARHRLTIVHINTQQDARDAIESGADGLAHLFHGSDVGKDFGALAASHHIFVVPTLSVLDSSCSETTSGDRLTADPLVRPYLDQDQLDRLHEGRYRAWLQRFGPRAIHMSCDGAQHAVVLLRDAGVPILVGTDAPNPATAHGATFHGEMELLVHSGLTPLETLQGATSKAAAAFHIPDRGRIAPGLRADLVLIDGDPTHNILDTRKIIDVWKEGVALHRPSRH